MTAYEFLKNYRDTAGFYLPYDRTNMVAKPSNGTIRRWLEQKSVLINNNFPGPQDELTFPLENLIFFPKSENKTTLW